MARASTVRAPSFGMSAATGAWIAVKIDATTARMNAGTNAATAGMSGVTSGVKIVATSAATVSQRALRVRQHPRLRPPRWARRGR